MFTDNDIVQPTGHAGEAAILSNLGLFLFLNGITQLPPVFRCNNAVLCRCLACFVLFQCLGELQQLFRANSLCNRYRCYLLGLLQLCFLLWSFHDFHEFPP